MTGVPVSVDADDFVRRHRSGETLKQLMAAFHIGHARAVAILADYGEAPVSNGVRSRKLSDERAAEMCRRYVAGETMEQLGPVFDVTSPVITAYLRRAGIQARPNWAGGLSAIEAMDSAVLHEKRTTAMRTRWADSTPEQRAAMVDAAHEATRGVPLSLERRERMAAGRELLARSDSEYEAQVAEWLRERSVPFVQQKAVGPYNLDFAIGNVGVEVTTGWARKKEWRPRLARILDEGWHLYFIWHDNADIKGGRGTCELLPGVADDLVAWVEFLKASPALRRQHRVIWRSRKIFSAGSGDADYLADVFRSNAPLGRWPLYDSAG